MSMYMDDFCKHIIPDIEPTIASFVTECKGRKIKSIRMIQDRVCQLTYPCKGHVGLKVKFSNGDMLEFNCPNTIMIGAITYFCKVKHEHSTSYLTQEIKTIIDNLRRDDYPDFKTVSRCCIL